MPISYCSVTNFGPVTRVVNTDNYLMKKAWLLTYVVFDATSFWSKWSVKSTIKAVTSSVLDQFALELRIIWNDVDTLGLPLFVPFAELKIKKKKDLKKGFALPVVGVIIIIIFLFTICGNVISFWCAIHFWWCIGLLNSVNCKKCHL